MSREFPEYFMRIEEGTLRVLNQGGNFYELMFGFDVGGKAVVYVLPEGHLSPKSNEVRPIGSIDGVMYMNELAVVGKVLGKESIGSNIPSDLRSKLCDAFEKKKYDLPGSRLASKSAQDD